MSDLTSANLGREPSGCPPSVRSRSIYAVVRPSVCRLSVCCNARAPYSAGIEIFGNFSGHLVPWLCADIHGKFYGDRPKRTPPSEGELNAREVAKYSDFGPIELRLGLYLGNGAR